MSHPYVPWPNLGELVLIAHIDRDQYTHYKDSHYMGCFFSFLTGINLSVKYSCYESIIINPLIGIQAHPL